MINQRLTADRIAECSLSKYRSLPKTGKPKPTEWTVVSCILQYKSAEDQLEVVALGTGTKCLSKDMLNSHGDRLHDSHAEIIARRAFIRYILDQLDEDASVGRLSLFEFDKNCNKFRMANDVSYHFFTTHPPCGDGSIFTQIRRHDECKRTKIERCDDDEDSEFGAILQPKDGFTGAKIVETTETGSDLMVQKTGSIRTKPGRGVRTLSVSCSDKMSRWAFAGIQGALLMTLLESPIYLASVTVSGPCNTIAIERAIWKRWEENEKKVKTNLSGYRLHAPEIQRTSSQIVFEHEKSDQRQPAPNSIVWCKIRSGERELEVAVAGKRQGVTKKHLNTTAGRVLICKVELLRIFLKLAVTKYPTVGRIHNVQISSTYAQAKNASKDYTEYCKQLKLNCFGYWTRKPIEIHNFCC